MSRVRWRAGEVWIRSFETADQSALVRYANNPAVAAYLRDRFPSPYTESDAAAWLSLAAGPMGDTHFAIATDTELVGGIGLERGEDVHRWSAELGYWLGEPFWGRGIATSAVAAMTEWGFRELRLERIFAVVFAANQASARVLEKCGFDLEARLRRSAVKHGKVTDELLYAKITTGP